MPFFKNLILERFDSRFLSSHLKWSECILAMLSHHRHHRHHRQCFPWNPQLGIIHPEIWWHLSALSRQEEEMSKLNTLRVKPS